MNVLLKVLENRQCPNKVPQPHLRRFGHDGMPLTGDPALGESDGGGRHYRRGDAYLQVAFKLLAEGSHIQGIGNPE